MRRADRNVCLACIVCGNTIQDPPRYPIPTGMPVCSEFCREAYNAKRRDERERGDA